MQRLDRCEFLGSALGGSTALAAGAPLFGMNRAVATADGSPLDSLFLTWQRDPTTTMTIQWTAPAAADDPTIRFAPAGKKSSAQSIAAKSRPYPMTDLRLCRAELTGLTPGTDYQFQIGEGAPTYRFRTMPAKG